MCRALRVGAKRTFIFCILAVAAITWSPSGVAQSGCVIDRGQDPLDILATLNVRDNVWILLDITSSMGATFAKKANGKSQAGQNGNGQSPNGNAYGFYGFSPNPNGMNPNGLGPSGQKESRIESAVRILKYIVGNFKDSAGYPAVNWSYSVFGGCKVGATLEVPLADCGYDNTQAVLNRIRVEKRSGTPIGISLYQTGQRVKAYPLRPGQKHYILMLTDGRENCLDDSPIAGNIQYDSQDPTRTRPAGGNASNGPAADPAADPLQVIDPGENDSKGGNSDDYETVRAGLMARDSINAIDPAGDASLGDIFTVGLGLKAEDRERTNHVAWQASNQRRGAFFADDPDELIQALADILSRITAPSATVTFTSPVVGTVKELVSGDVTTAKGTSGTNPYVKVAQIQVGQNGDAQAAMSSRNIVVANRNNVLFSTSTDFPGFKTHLLAQKAFSVKLAYDANGNSIKDSYGNLLTQKVPSSFETFWDAGEELQKRSPATRAIFFSRAGAGKLIPFRASMSPDQGVTPGDLGVGTGFLDELDGTAGTGALTPLDAVAMVVGVIRGYRLSIHAQTGTFYKPLQEGGGLNLSERECDGLDCPSTWKLLDATHAGPTLAVNPARSPDDAPMDPPGQPLGKTYSDFFRRYIDRLSVVYMGTNGGMTHAFRADTGFELFAYIPDDVIGLGPTEPAGSRKTLQDLVRLLVGKNNGIRNHVFSLTGPATVEDVFLRSANGNGADDDWHTVIAFGRGPGGKALTGLDVTRIPNWDGTLNNSSIVVSETAPPVRLLFNRVNRGPGNNSYSLDAAPLDGLGETWSTPALGQVRLTAANSQSLLPQWVLFAGSGYGCSGTDEGKFFYVLRIEDGAVLKRLGNPGNYSQPIPSDPGAAIQNNVLAAPPTAFNPHLYDPSRADTDDYVTRVYIGDAQGNLYKLDTSGSDPNSWGWSYFYQLGTDARVRMGLNQPFTAPVALLYRDRGQGPSVFAGTGGDLRVAKSPAAPFLMVGLFDNAANGATVPGQPIPISPGGALLPGGGPFLLPLSFGERVYVAPTTAPSATGGVVYFAASTPGDPTINCLASFTSNLYGFYAGTGIGAFTADAPGLDGTSRQSLDAGKATGVYARDGRLFAGRSGGFGLDGGTTRILGDDLNQADPPPMSTSGIQLRIERIVPSGF